MLVTKLKKSKTDEKLMLVLLLGALDALKQEKINTEEVQEIIPRLALDGKVDQNVQSLFEEAWELDDAKDFGILDESITVLRNKTLKLLSKYDAYPDEMWLGFDLDD